MCIYIVVDIFIYILKSFVILENRIYIVVLGVILEKYNGKNEFI